MSVARLESQQLLDASALEELDLFERYRYVREVVLGVTQKRMAELAGVNIRTVKGWEHPEQPRGAPKMQSARRVVELAAAAGAVYPAELFTTVGPPRLLDEVNRKLDLILAHLGIEA